MLETCTAQRPGSGQATCEQRCGAVRHAAPCSHVEILPRPTTRWGVAATKAPPRKCTTPFGGLFSGTNATTPPPSCVGANGRRVRVRFAAPCWRRRWGGGGGGEEAELLIARTIESASIAPQFEGRPARDRASYEAERSAGRPQRASAGAPSIASRSIPKRCTQLRRGVVWSGVDGGSGGGAVHAEPPQRSLRTWVTALHFHKVAELI